MIQLSITPVSNSTSDQRAKWAKIKWGQIFPVYSSLLAHSAIKMKTISYDNRTNYFVTFPGPLYLEYLLQDCVDTVGIVFYRHILLYQYIIWVT